MEKMFKSVEKSLEYWANKAPKKIAYTFLVNGEEQTQTITYEVLRIKAKAVAATLQTTTQKGDRVLLVYPSGLDFIAAFYGCLYAGVVAVPVFHKIKQNPERLSAIIEDATPVAVLTKNVILEKAKTALTPKIKDLKWLTIESITDDKANSYEKCEVTKETIAFLQYTSGSTAAPKGVMVSHENLLYQFAIISHSTYQNSSTNIFTWLPLYHDMGLIGNVLFNVYLGGHCVFMSPISFLKKPIRWLRAISSYKINLSGAPNFAFDLVLKKATVADIEALDLSSWGVAFCGAEPIRAATMQAFQTTFEKVGFQKSTLFPCYGLAEATLMVTGTGIGNDFQTIEVDKTGIELAKVQIMNQQSSQTKPLVASGSKILKQAIHIVDPFLLKKLGERTVGEIWVAGKHIAKGYWNKPIISKNQLQARLTDEPHDFLRTGDLGFFHQGNLYVTGRIKDLIKIRGRSIYPQDLEYAIEHLQKDWQEIRDGGTGVFSFEKEGREQVAVLVEIKPRLNKNHDPKALAKIILQAISEKFEIRLTDIVFIKSGTLPKTTSGKIQRHACRKLYLSKFKDYIKPLNSLAEFAEEVSLEPKSKATALDFSSKKEETIEMDLDELAEILALDEEEIIQIPVLSNNVSQQSDTKTLADWMIAWLSKELNISPMQINTNESLANYGLDSLTAIELVDALERKLKTNLSNSLVFDYKTIDGIIGHLGKLQK